MGMKFRTHGCGPRGMGPIPEAILAMGMGGRGWKSGPWDWDFEFGGGRRGRGGRGRMFESGELRLVLLRLIADQPRHGYDLIRETEAEGSRKVFAVTTEGEAHLAERKDEIDALISRLEDMGEDKRKAGGAPIKRAVGNLLSALWHRVTREDADEETLHEIAAILDEAAQKIERLK